MKKPILLLLLTIFFITSVKSQTYNYYYGNIHSQTSYSDGNKDSATSFITKPIQAFNYAKSSQHIDFYGVSDHNHASAGFSSLANYHQGIADATAATTSSFVAMYGFEWGVISGGGHVIVYGCDSLMGWDAGLYDIYVAQSDYTNLWKKVISRPNSFAYLCHPTTTDYGNILTTAVNANADSAIIGMAGRSGPAFSTNTTYSNPSTSNYISQYNDALKFGYHVGVGLDHDSHNSVFGRQTAGRLVVLAPTLTKANIYNAFKKMRFYASDDWNAKVNFQILNQPMGSIITHSGTPTLSVTITDPDVAETVSSIVVYYGVPGSGTTCTALTTVTNTSTLTYNHATAANLSKFYYYLEITQTDGDIIWTSPIWYNRNDAYVASVPVASCSTPTTSICSGQSATFTDASTNSPTSWAWTAVGATPSSSSVQNPTFTYTTAGTYSVTLVASNSNGSSAMITKTLTVKAIPSVAVNSPSICVGSSTVLTASGATSYSWSTGITTNTISVTPATTTSYTVSGTTLGCSKAVTAIVTVNPLPVLTVNSATICSGTSATLTVSGASSYSWNSGATSNTVIVSPLTTTNYTVIGTTGGCSKTSTTNVSVNSTPSITANTPSICVGSSTIVSATGATTYNWNTGATTSSITVTPTVNTNYTVTGTSNGCTNTKVVTVTVNNSPNVSANSSTICAGSMGTLVATGATTYSWNTGATSSSISVTPTVTTNYTVTGTSNGCTNTKVVTVTVNNSPNVSANSSTICAGSTGTLVATGATTYLWNTGATTSSISVTPTVTTNYTVTGTTGGCSNTKTVSVTINTKPTVSVNNATICSGSTGTLVASGANTYTWNTGATGASLAVSPSVNTNYTVTGTSSFGCINSTTASVTVGTAPSIAVNSTSICSGATATLTASGVSTFTWSNGFNTASISVNPTSTTVYTVTGNLSGCAASTNNTATVTVVSNPTVSVNNASICSGSSATLSATGATSYAWNTGAFTPTIFVSPLSTTNYTVMGTSGSCSSTKVVTVTVVATPTANAGSSQTITCISPTVSLSGSGTTTYTWSGTGIVSSGNTSSPVINMPGTYTLVGSTAGCSSSPVTVNVVANTTAPSVMSTTSGSLNCITSSVNVVVSTVVNPASYNWSGSGITAGVGTATITVNQGGAFNYTVTNMVNGCSSTGSQSVIQNTMAPTLSVTSSTICSGSTGTLTASGSATSYSWNTGTTGPNLMASPISNTNYTVTGTAANGCIKTASSSISVGSVPFISVNSSTICTGATATLTASGVNTYTWSTSSNASNISVNPTATTVYTVTGNLTGCSATATQTTIVTVNSLPNVTLGAISGPLCVNNAPIALSGSPSGGVYSGIGVSGSSFNPAVSGSGTFTISYNYTDANVCSASASQTLSVSLCTGITELYNSSVSIYPNPTKDVIHVTIDASLVNKSTIKLYDAIGNLLISEKANNTTTEISFIPFATGMYTIRIVSENKQTIIKVIRQ